MNVNSCDCDIVKIPITIFNRCVAQSNIFNSVGDRNFFFDACKTRKIFNNTDYTIEEKKTITKYLLGCILLMTTKLPDGLTSKMLLHIFKYIFLNIGKGDNMETEDLESAFTATREAIEDDVSNLSSAEYLKYMNICKDVRETMLYIHNLQCVCNVICETTNKEYIKFYLLSHIQDETEEEH
jgi:hypothetical protein